MLVLQGFQLIGCREEGIRTLDTLLAYTRFPSGLLQPLGHLSVKDDKDRFLIVSNKVVVVEYFGNDEALAADFAAELPWTLLMPCCGQKTTHSQIHCNGGCLLVRNRPQCIAKGNPRELFFEGGQLGADMS